MLFLLDNNLIFDTQALTLFDREHRCSAEIGANEAGILLMLIQAEGQARSRDDIIAEVWRRQRGIEVDTSSVGQSISALRKLLGDNAQQQQMIRTVPRGGYALAPTLAVEALPMPTITTDDSADATTAPKAISASSNRNHSQRLLWLLPVLIALLFAALLCYRYLLEHHNADIERVELNTPSATPIYQLSHYPVTPDFYPLISKCITKAVNDSSDTIDTVIISSDQRSMINLLFHYRSDSHPIRTLKVGINTGISIEDNLCGL